MIPQQGPPKTIYEKYFVSTQSLFAFTSALELYKLFGAVLPVRVTNSIINTINTSSMGVALNQKMTSMAAYVAQKLKTTFSSIFSRTASNLSSFVSSNLAQKFSYIFNTLQILNGVAYFLGGLYMAYSAFLNFKGDDVIRAGVDVASSGMYFFAAAATVVGVLFSVQVLNHWRLYLRQ